MSPLSSITCILARERYTNLDICASLAVAQDKALKSGILLHYHWDAACCRIWGRYAVLGPQTVKMGFRIVTWNGKLYTLSFLSALRIEMHFSSNHTC